MVVIRKDWQALPVNTTTISAPNIETRPQPTPTQQLPDNIQKPTTHISSGPERSRLKEPEPSLSRRDGHDVVELQEINYDEPNEPMATYIPPPPIVVKPKKKSQIIKQEGILDQFSFNSSSLMIGGAVIAGLVFIMSAGKGTVKTRIGQDSLSGFY